MKLGRLWERCAGRFQRESSVRIARRPFRMRTATPIISFSFDDFPRSALHVAGSILQSQEIGGTYYTSLGLMGQTAPTGEIFHREDLARVLAGGHELGCHTYAHCHSWDTSPEEFEANIKRNSTALQELGIHAPLESLSYPISGPRPGTKRRARKYFSGCRAGGQIYNSGEVDLDHLKAFFLEQSRDRPEAILAMIDAAVAANGWLIFATHDVDPDPTQFGCTPELFELVVAHAIRSGAKILPVSASLREIGAIREA